MSNELKTFEHKVNALPSRLVPNDHYFLRVLTNKAKHYIGGKNGEAISIESNTSINTKITVIAGEIISRGKPVIIDEDGKAYIYNIINEDHYFKLFGISAQGVLLGEQLDVYIQGQVYEADSGWSIGKTYFVSLTSILTDIQPDIGIIKQVGVGIAKDTIMLDNSFSLIKI